MRVATGDVVVRGPGDLAAWLAGGVECVPSPNDAANSSRTTLNAARWLNSRLAADETPDPSAFESVGVEGCRWPVGPGRADRCLSSSSEDELLASSARAATLLRADSESARRPWLRIYPVPVSQWFRWTATSTAVSSESSPMAMRGHQPTMPVRPRVTEGRGQHSLLWMHALMHAYMYCTVL